MGHRHRPAASGTLYEGAVVVNWLGVVLGMGCSHSSMATFCVECVFGESLRWSISGSGPSGGQGSRGTLRSEGLLFGEHPPDGGGDPAGDVDSGNFGSLLWSESLFDPLILFGV